MKKTTYFLFFLSLFLISSFLGFSQSKDANAIITLYSEDFSSGTINTTSLNDSSVTDYNTSSWASGDNDNLYTFDHSNHAAASATANDWLIAGHNSDTGYTSSGQSGNRAGIYAATTAWQEQSLITPTWTASRSIMTITFSYNYYDAYGSDGFYVYLQHRSGTDDFSNLQTLVSIESEHSSVNYSSGNIVVTPGYEYRLVFRYDGYNDYGAQVDTILVQHPTLSNLTVSSNQTISDSQTYADLTVDNGITLTIAKTGNLTVTGTITNNGTIILQSDANEFASLISKASSTTITYERYVNIVGANEWDLIGSPVAGQTFSGFVTANDGDLATDGSGPVEYAIGLYDNSDNTYDNYDSGTVGSDPFDIGLGYAMASVNGETLDFTGTTAIVDQEQAITTEEGSGGKKWNLVANPYPSFLNVNTKAHTTNNFITINGTANLHNSFLAVYGYDGDGVGVEYTIYNHSSASAVYIAPGQGFFVAADAGVDLDFTEAMQTVIGADDFISGDIMDDVYEVLLRLYHGNQKIAKTRLYFENGLSLGLDPGYDAGAFDQSAALMTRLVEEDEGHGMAINAMSTEDMDDVVIPLEINQTAGQEFRVNLHTSTIGEVNVYLEDTELETLTLLNEEDFVFTPTYDLSDAGRFYVHLTANTLSNEEVNTSLLNAYKGVDNNYITIEGLATQATSTEVSLYNILGTKVMDTTLDNTTNIQTISTNGFATGIYVLKLESGKNQLTKKLIIK